MMMAKVPFLVGATASGKTAVAIEVAEKVGAEIISADSRQIYKDMVIGSAQPTKEETDRVPHHFIDYLNIDKTFSAGEYGRQARAKIAELQEKVIVPFVVGGSGLYISALANDFFRGPSADPEIRAQLKGINVREGTQKLHEKLKEVDPDSAEKIMPSDYRRIERALEIYYLTGMPISEVRRQEANPPAYQPVMLGLQWPRDQLYERINRRCLQMLEIGLIDEVKSLIEGKDTHQPDFLTEYNALNSVGYVEVIQYLKDDIDYDEMVRLFQRNTRRFAKRQISWFGRDERIAWIPIDDSKNLSELAMEVSKPYSQMGIGFEATD
jgi:tRNA dimethylallyltransferase